MITIRNLTKCFNTLVAVNNLNLEIKPGELFGFLGPNGAGKTTTLRMMAGLIKPTAGTIIIDSHDLALNPLAAKQVTSFIPDRPYLYNKLTGRELLRFIGGLYHLPDEETAARAAHLLNLFSLTDWGDELIETYSHGMKQRLVMAAALLPRPKVIIVDEPMVGLDPAGSKLVKDLFKGLCARGATVFMSTHSLDIVEELCGRIGIIQDGRLIAVGTLKELRDMTGAVGKKLEEVFFKLTEEQERGDLTAALRV